MNRRLTIERSTLAILSAAVLISAGCNSDSPPTTEKPRPEVTFKPQEVTDALHAVIAANRRVYARDVLQRLEDEKIVRATENWKEDKSLPLPEQMLRLATHEIQRGGAEFHYALRSLWPVNPKNAPETSTEKTGLQFVLEHPDSNFYAEESLGGRRYFTAVYPDRAIVASCVSCHNRHENSPRNNFKLGDLMGGLVVRVPLEF